MSTRTEQGTAGSSPGYQRYVLGEVPRFNAKNHAFSRAIWDPEMKAVGARYFGLQHPSDKEGYRLEDYAAYNASWYAERRFGRGNQGGNFGLYDWECLEDRVNKIAPGFKLAVDDPQKMARRIKRVAQTFGASLVGICRLDRRWLYSHQYDRNTGQSNPVELPEECNYVVVMAVEMDYRLISLSPQVLANAGAGLGYSKMAFISGLVAQFIRLLGYQAIPTGNDTGLCIPMAVDAGLGEMGRNGLLIAPLYGPRVRLCKVITNLPMTVDKPIDLGIQDFCDKCEKCAELCPVQCIMYGQRTARPNNLCNNTGLLKWPIDAEKCLKFWAGNGSASCSVCIRTCPFNKEDAWIHRLSGGIIRRTTQFNRFFVWLDDLLRYGKQVPTHKYWY